MVGDWRRGGVGGCDPVTSGYSRPREHAKYDELSFLMIQRCRIRAAPQGRLIKVTLILRRWHHHDGDDDDHEEINELEKVHRLRKWRRRGSSRKEGNIIMGSTFFDHRCRWGIIIPMETNWPRSRIRRRRRSRGSSILGQEGIAQEERKGFPQWVTGRLKWRDVLINIIERLCDDLWVAETGNLHRNSQPHRNVPLLCSSSSSSYSELGHKVRIERGGWREWESPKWILTWNCGHLSILLRVKSWQAKRRRESENLSGCLDNGIVL